MTRRAFAPLLAIACLLPLAALAQEEGGENGTEEGGDAAEPEPKVEAGEPLIADDMWEFGETIRLGLKLHIGLGGEVEWDVHATGYSYKDDDDMEATAGFALLGEVSIVRHFSLGFSAGFYFFASDDMEDENIDRNAWIDFTPVFKVHYPLLDGKVELFAKFLVGLTITVPSDDFEDDTGADTGAAWNVGLHFGASYRIWDGISIFAEIGWLGHGGQNEFTQTVNPGPPPVRASGDIEYEIHQFALNIGALYDL